ncbi:MAG: bifunctional phosphopantothenoylcysteine decarboxylase/phosphopantothenate--cysteine ligase CoaBC [Acidimicrobiia bacterium]|nr:bifunctional phosphopantothenoylcysteine decarboxylase/phosphopantothenate--cysteine ligase CoaBC [Acidimicrobiia bacterium]
MLTGRNVVLGVSGGVAAYKAAYLARRLVERGADVRVVMTESAAEFVGPATFAAITGVHPVVDLFDDEDVSPHTTLARWADLIVVAPATASTLSKIAHGDASNALVATVVASTAPVVVAPAMHTEMWEHPATGENIQTLRGFGYTLVEPDAGDLAGGDVGVGRLASPDDIADVVQDALIGGDLTATSVVITAGGTREPIDPVRYIGNRSSGKMGNALAVEAARRGADVTLVTTAPAPNHPGITVVPVETADEMADAVWHIADETQIAIMAAAVADFRPADPETRKLVRSDGPPDLVLEPTPDVLAGFRERAPEATLVGFAAQVGDLSGVEDKAERKRVDLLVANDVSRPGTGFGSDDNEVTLVFHDGVTKALPIMSKRDVAKVVIDTVVELRS